VVSIRRLTRINRLTASLDRGVPLERGPQIDGVVIALLVQVLADEAFVPDQQAGDQSEPVSDDQSLIDVRRRRCEDDDSIAQIDHDMAVEAEIRLLLTGAKTSDTMKKSQ
jgi:hypothetical protein